MPSPKVEPVALSDEERSVLSGWSCRRKTAQALAARSRIVLRCAEGGTIGQVAADLADRAGDHENAGREAQAGHALVDPVDGLGDRDVPVDGVPPRV